MTYNFEYIKINISSYALTHKNPVSSFGDN